MRHESIRCETRELHPLSRQTYLKNILYLQILLFIATNQSSKLILLKHSISLRRCFKYGFWYEERIGKDIVLLLKGQRVFLKTCIKSRPKDGKCCRTRFAYAERNTCFTGTSRLTETFTIYKDTFRNDRLFKIKDFLIFFCLTEAMTS